MRLWFKVSEFYSMHNGGDIGTCPYNVQSEVKCQRREAARNAAWQAVQR